MNSNIASSSATSGTNRGPTRVAAHEIHSSPVLRFLPTSKKWRKKHLTLAEAAGDDELHLIEQRNSEGGRVIDSECFDATALTVTRSVAGQADRKPSSGVRRSSDAAPRFTLDFGAASKAWQLAVENEAMLGEWIEHFEDLGADVDGCGTLTLDAAPPSTVANTGEGQPAASAASTAAPAPAPPGCGGGCVPSSSAASPRLRPRES